MLNHAERREIHELLSSTLPLDASAGPDSVQAFMGEVVRAEKEGRTWPDGLREELLRGYAYDEQKKIAKSRSIVLVDHNGRKHAKAARVGTWKTEKGRKYQTQELLTAMTWEEVWAWEGAIDAQIQALKPNLTIAARLHALQERYPDSETPAAALKCAGMTLEQWIADAAS